MSIPFSAALGISPLCRTLDDRTGFNFVGQLVHGDFGKQLDQSHECTRDEKGGKGDP